MQFRPASRKARKLRFALGGPAGSGKTYTALLIARGLVGPSGRIGVIDTENRSADLYADVDNIGNFGVLELDNPSPEAYIDALVAAVEAKCDVVVIDSISHEWSGSGGILSIVDEVSKTISGNKYAAWGEGTSRHNTFLETLLSCPFHLIATMRSKMSYEQGRNAAGRTVIRKLGMQPVQRDGVEYEFDVFGQMDDAHTLFVHKSRADFLDTGDTIQLPGLDLGRRLGAWLNNDEFADELATTHVDMSEAAMEADLSSDADLEAQPNG
ncbi:MAG: ATP-binding protein [Bacteroidota bacterium]